MSVTQYLRFLIVGTFVGLLTVGCRELIGLALAADSVLNYSISVVVAYLVGIICSYLLNGRYTFRSRGAARAVPQFITFIAIAGVGMLITWLLSLGVRYGLRLDVRLGQFAAAVAFGSAALLSSLVTYPLNAMLVFGHRHRSAGSKPTS